jgi:hypothetical protein
MPSKSRFLTAASVAALAVTSGAAVANRGADYIDRSADVRAPIERSIGSGALVTLLDRTHGVLTPQSTRSALLDMYGTLSREQAEGLPELMADIRGLGVARVVEVAAAETMAELIATAPALAAFGELQVSIAGQIGDTINGSLAPVQVAQFLLPDGSNLEELCLLYPDPVDQRLNDIDCSLLAGAPQTTGSTLS